MDIKQIVKWSLAAIFVVTFHYATHATANASQDQSVQLPEDAYRVQYQNSADMPDHFAYLALMQNLSQADHESGRAANIEHIQDHIGIDIKKAEAFLMLVLTSYDEMVETNRAVTNRMLCIGDKPKYEVNEAYAVLDVLDDIKETNLRKQYQVAMLELGNNSTELNTWLLAIKSGTTHHKYDHQRVFEYANQSVEEVISTACNMLASNDASNNVSNNVSNRARR